MLSKSKSCLSAIVSTILFFGVLCFAGSFITLVGGCLDGAWCSRWGADYWNNSQWTGIICLVCYALLYLMSHSPKRQVPVKAKASPKPPEWPEPLPPGQHINWAALQPEPLSPIGQFKTRTDWDEIKITGPAHARAAKEAEQANDVCAYCGMTREAGCGCGMKAWTKRGAP